MRRKPTTDLFSKMLPEPRPDKDEESVRLHWSSEKGHQERKQISEVARKQSAAFRKVKKPSITHTRYIIIRTSTPSPRVTARGQMLTRKTPHSFMLPSQSAVPDSDCSIWKILDDPWPPGDSYL